MQKMTLYRYVREDGGISVSPIRPDVPYTELTRLVAEENRYLTDGKQTAVCVDTDHPEAWQEILPDSEVLEIILGGAV